MARRMDEREWRAFVSEGTRTGKLATVRADGRPHVVPIWFVLDGDDLVFNTGAETVKGRNLRRTGRACLCVDDERPPFAYVMVEGPVTLSEDVDAMLPLSTAIGARYMGAERGAEFGARNAVPGELLVRLRAEHVAALASVAD
jgi:PPOX class probable F420-dependent enzyme